MHSGAVDYVHQASAACSDILANVVYIQACYLLKIYILCSSNALHIHSDAILIMNSALVQYVIPNKAFFFWFGGLDVWKRDLERLRVRVKWMVMVFNHRQDCVCMATGIVSRAMLQWGQTLSIHRDARNKKPMLLSWGWTFKVCSKSV